MTPQTGIDDERPLDPNTDAAVQLGRLRERYRLMDLASALAEFTEAAALEAVDWHFDKQIEWLETHPNYDDGGLGEFPVDTAQIERLKLHQAAIRNLRLTWAAEEDEHCGK